MADQTRASTSTKRPNDDANDSGNKRIDATMPLQPPIPLDRTAQTAVGRMPRFLFDLYNDGASRMSELTADVLVCMLAPLFTTCNGTRRLPGAVRIDEIKVHMQSHSEKFDCSVLVDFYCNERDELVVVTRQAHALDEYQTKPFTCDEPELVLRVVNMTDSAYKAQLNVLNDNWVRRDKANLQIFRDSQTHKHYVLATNYARFMEISEQQYHDRLTKDTPEALAITFPFSSRYIDPNDISASANVSRATVDGAGAIALMTMAHGNCVVTIYFPNRQPLVVYKHPWRAAVFLDAMMTFTGNGDLALCVRDKLYSDSSMRNCLVLIRTGRGGVWPSSRFYDALSPPPVHGVVVAL
jgi:hypothetical protein